MSGRRRVVPRSTRRFSRRDCATPSSWWSIRCAGAPWPRRETYEYSEEAEHLSKRLADEGIRFSVREPTRGKSASEDLLESARREDVGLIVNGIRRRSPVGKLVLGSNAQDILLDADCPVLAVKAG